MPEGNYTADDDESLSSLTPEQLKSELEACRSIIKNQDESLARTKQELEDTREEGSAWRCQYEALHKKHKIKETNYSCLTTQLKHLQEERDRTVKELEETRAKVEQFSSYKRMKDILDHSTEEAADMLKDGAYTRQELVKCLLTVKTRYGHAKKSKEATQDDLTAAEAKIEGMREHLVESVAECQSLRKENVTLTTRIDSLQKKVRMLEKAMESPESKRTLCRIFESPMPGPSRKKQRLTDSEEEDTSDVILLPDSPAPSKYSHLQEKAAE
jgi:chromosome segregation ATPase